VAVALNILPPTFDMFMYFLTVFRVSWTWNIIHFNSLTARSAVDVGACMEPLAVAWYAVKRSGYKKGQTALIVGAGPVSNHPIWTF
jgi:hypothetical protein